MKIRNSKTLLVLSSAQLGMDDDILAVYASAAKAYKAEVIHLGPTATKKEIAAATKTRGIIESLKNRLDFDMKEPSRMKLEGQLEDAERTLKAFETLEADRVKTLVARFGKVTFVTTPKLCISQDFTRSYGKGATQVFKGVEVSKYLFLSALPPSGVRTTRSPISTISIDLLKSLGKSWIVPHPVPTVECYAREGLNEAYSYYTVGSLKRQSLPEVTEDQYLYAHMPCAVMVVLDTKNSEFHPKQMHIDFIEMGGEKVPAILDDGMVITAKGIKEVKSDDKASVATDAHVPYTHPGFIGATRAINMLHKPGTFIDAGDAADFDPISHHNEHKPGERENKRLIDTLVGLRQYYDAITACPSIKRKVSLDSNHHEWVTDFVMKNPALIGMLDWSSLAKSHFSDWEVLIRSAGEPTIFRFGDITFRHGDQEAGLKDAERKFHKYVCGHWHRYASFRRAQQLGCGAKLGPKYIRGSVNAWQNQMGTVTKYNGAAAMNAKIILHDEKAKVSRVAYRDKILEVPFYDLFEPRRPT